MQQCRDDGQTTVIWFNCKLLEEAVEQYAGERGTSDRMVPIRNLDRESIEQALRILVDIN
jgi:hypothetical protein